MVENAIQRPLQCLATLVTKLAPSVSTQTNIPHNHPRFLRFCKDLKSVLQLHAQILVSGVEPDDYTNTQLVNSYSLFRKPDLARSVFDSASNPSVILWNSMIRAHAKANQSKEAVNLYHNMLEKGLEPDKYTFTFVLKAYAGASDLEGGVLIHREIARRGLQSDVYVGTALIDLYCKMGHIRSARELFDQMPKLDIVAWNAMIAGLSQSMDPHEAIEFFRKMQLAGIEPNSVSLLNLFPAISRLSAIQLCRSVHGFVVKRDFPLAVSNALIDMYSKCCDVDVARRIFDRMRRRDDVSCGTMMAGYAHNACFLEVLELFDYLNGTNLRLNQVSAVSALLAASEMRDLEKGWEIHDCIIQEGIVSHIMVATALMTMYAKCGEIEKAKQLFENIQERDVVSCSAMVAALVQTGHFGEAFSLFRGMQKENLRPNRVTIVSILPACIEPSALNLGKSIHCYVLKANIGLDSLTGTALVAMYAKCGSFTNAEILFNGLPYKDVVTWNALINGYAQIGDAYHAMKRYCQMRLAGHGPDSGTIVGVLPACVLLDALRQGTCIHGQIIKGGFDSDLHVKNALIDMYAKCGSLSIAEYLFSETGFLKDEISWNILIAGYLQNGCAKEAISAFHQMRLENLQPNLVTIVSILPAAAFLAALKEGMALHAYTIRRGFLSNIQVGNSLIDMYAKCGCLDYAEKFFNEMDNKDRVSWNAMLAGYAIHGHGEQAIKLFLEMPDNSVEFDSVSFLSVLSACRYGGLIEKGRKFFYSMSSNYHFEPELEHYACMVDLLGRAGQLEEAWDLIQRMPMTTDAGVWGALLGSCKLHSDIRLGEVALEHLTTLEPGNPSHYVVLSNIYAQSGRWGDAGKLRTKMNSTGLKKTPGCSWVEIKNTIHAFRVGDESHPQFGDMRAMWNDLLDQMEKMGYTPDTSDVLHDVEEEEKQSFLFSHSERLAVAFALLNTESGSTIQIVKNLRVCNDCHTALKFISEIASRRIIVRDANRFHHFEQGACSCKDYW